MSEYKQQLTRAISKIGIAAIAINGLIGAGIFALPSAAAELSGNFSPWMFLICGVLMATIILSFAQLSSHFNDNGGPVLYAQEAFGSFVAFQTTWLLYIGRVTALAANSNALVFYLGLFIPVVNEGLLHNITILAVILLLTSLNLFGVKSVIKFLNIVTLIKLIPLFGFLIVGLSYIEPQKIFSNNLSDITNFNGALLLLVYAFIGFEGAVVPAGESKNPTKNIAFALSYTLIFTIILYFCIQSISISVIDDLANTKTPLADAASVMMGSYGMIIITIAAAISIFGNLFTIVFTAPRMTYALAKTGNLPQWFAVVSRKNQSPKNSILFLCVIASFLAITGSFVWLAIISSLARLLGYLISILALIKMHPKLIKENQWFLPLGKSIPFLAIFVCGWLSYQASLASWLMTAIFIIIGSLLFYFRQKSNE